MIQMFVNVAIYTLVFFSCVSGPKESIVFDGRIGCGAERMHLYLDNLKGKSVGVVVNQTSIVQNVHLVDSLISLGVNVKKIFSPEHGFRGMADAGEKVDDNIDQTTGLEIISLYGKNKKPDAKQLEDIDILVFDIQDVGVRFYTYISTLHYVMEAAAENDIPLIVLDRPNPNAHYIDGPVLDTAFRSFVGMHTVPVVYGMTIGEYAFMINGEGWLNEGIQCRLKIIPCMNYHHDIRYILPVKPSPNLPNGLSVVLYPSLCFFEGTTVSVGRGTEMPFQIYGHPESNRSPFSFVPKSGPGSKYPKHENKECYGYDLRNQIPVRDRLDLSHILKMYHDSKYEDYSFFNDNNFFDKLAGSAALKKMIKLGYSEEEIRMTWQEDLTRFKEIRSNYLIYEE